LWLLLPLASALTPLATLALTSPMALAPLPNALLKPVPVAWAPAPKAEPLPEAMAPAPTAVANWPVAFATVPIATELAPPDELPSPIAIDE
jgi:hypothetical protein